ncbi:hypothetical protein BJ742DRAFT_905437 [Cladochytrium replicatum]|nr:hypothetical protein BJ742DRAFT_905437 [Cladochytrium replicatum]
METTDYILLTLTMSLALAMLLASTYRLVYVQTRFNIVCFASSTLLALRTIIAVVYYKIMWLNAPARYAILFFGLNTSEALLYYLYERRLAVFFQRGGAAFQWTMYTLIGIYELTTLGQMYVFGSRASNTASGGYTVSGVETSYIKMAVYIEDAVIGVVILIGTLVSLGRIISENKRAGIYGSLEIYRAIVTSDALMFLFAITSFDPTGQSGALPQGNFGFQHLLDTLKNVLMTVNLILPSKIAASRSGSRTNGSSKGGSWSARTEHGIQMQVYDGSFSKSHV